MKSYAFKMLLLALLLVPGWASAQQPFSDIYIFGDSLSDNGNLAAIPGFEFLQPSPVLPYNNGFSNGPRAVELLAEGLGLEANPALHLVTFPPLGTNFAVAGARAVTLGTPPTIDLPTQIQVFLQSQGGVSPEDALYVVFIGGNDIRGARGEADLFVARELIDDAILGVEEAIQTLAVTGAQHFLVADAPDIGIIPETDLVGGDPLVRRASKLSRHFNVQLQQLVQRLEHEFGLDIVEFDTAKFIRFVRSSGEQLGFANTDDPCFFTSVFLSTGVPQFHPACGLDGFDQFVFFDEIHPTALVHELVGNAMLELVQEYVETQDGESMFED